MSAKIIKNANLPKGRAALILISNENKETVLTLRELGIQTLAPEPDPKLGRLCGHTDILVHHLCDNELLFSRGGDKTISALERFGFCIKTIKTPLGAEYPENSRLNAVEIGKKLICNKSIVAEEILLSAELRRTDIIHANQGYAKCSCAVIAENTLITDDVSIKRVCDENMIDALLIEKGSVRLKGFDYGFIGGCCGMIDEHTLAFVGDIKTHSSCSAVIKFLDKHNVEPLALKKGELIDVGGLLPLLETI